MTDVFRKEHKPLSSLAKDSMIIIKDKAELLLMEFDSCLVDIELNADKRYMALAKTALEESVMWAIKGITT